MDVFHIIFFLLGLGIGAWGGWRFFVARSYREVYGDKANEP